MSERRNDDEYNIVEKYNKRIGDITGLYMAQGLKIKRFLSLNSKIIFLIPLKGSAEELQVGNYGIGGKKTFFLHVLQWGGLFGNFRNQKFYKI